MTKLVYLHRAWELRYVFASWPAHRRGWGGGDALWIESVLQLLPGFTWLEEAQVWLMGPKSITLANSLFFHACPDNIEVTFLEARRLFLTQHHGLTSARFAMWPRNERVVWPGPSWKRMTMTVLLKNKQTNMFAGIGVWMQELEDKIYSSLFGIFDWVESA